MVLVLVSDSTDLFNAETHSIASVDEEDPSVSFSPFLY